MASKQNREDTSDQTEQTNEGQRPASGPRTDEEYVRGGKGRRDEVGPTGIYPLSALDAAPADAVAIGQEELGHVDPRKDALMVIEPDDKDE